MKRVLRIAAIAIAIVIAIFLMLLVYGVYLVRQKNPPLTQLDTGGHMAQVLSVAFTPDGKFLVSAGDDKAVRVWDLRAGKTVRTIRGRSGLGQEGKIYAMALSPDGRWLAVGGWMTRFFEHRSHIRLYDFASGELKALLVGHSQVVNSLAFSPDGKKLISGGPDSIAIVWDIETQTLLHRLEGHRGDVHAVGFTADAQRAVTGSYDNTLRLWRVDDGALIQEMKGHGDKVYALAVSPMDGSIASGDLSGEIRLWDGKTGALKKVLANQGGSVGSLRFSPDGYSLLSTCAAAGCNLAQRVYDAASGKELTAYTKQDNVVGAGAFSPDGGLVATGGGEQFPVHVWDPGTGDTKAVLKGTGHPRWAVGFSADGRGIAWGNTNIYRRSIGPLNNRGPLEIAMRLPGADEALGEPQPVKNAEGWVRANASSGALSLQHRKGGNYGYDDAILDLLKDGKPSGVSIERGPGDGYRHRSYGFTPDGKQIVSGGDNGVLAAYGLDGKKLGDFVGHEGDVWAVAVSPDGRYLVSGSADQTVRLWNLKTRELIVTIFRGEDGEWVMWTPQGFYTATAAGARLIGWLINRGWENEAEYVTAAQLRQHLNRPDIVERAIVLASAEAAVEEARATNFKLTDLLGKPVPRLRIVSPEPDAAATGGRAKVTVELGATPDPVKAIRLHVNGRLVAVKQLGDGAGSEPARLTFDVPLAKGANTVAVAAENGTGETVARLNLRHKGEGALDRPGTLYVLAIGVDKYPNLRDKDLAYAGADAKAFAEAIEKRAGPSYRNVVKRALVNGAAAQDEPTTANILDALSTLRRARENDTVMLFVSGHGVNEGPEFQFAPTDAAWGTGTLLKQSAVVPWRAFGDALIGARGRRTVFLDTCHAGSAFNRRFLSDGYEANITFYSSARSDQEALEDVSLGGGHGLFTYALMEGMNGGARDGAGEVRADGLRDFVKARVGALAAKFEREQEPQYFRARDAENFVLARTP